MVLSQSSDRSDVVENGFLAAELSVGTTQTEVKVGASRVSARQVVGIYNNSSSTIFYGPTGVTTSGANKGFPIFKDEKIYLPIGDTALYLIAGSASNSVLIQEIS